MAENRTICNLDLFVDSRSVLIPFEANSSQGHINVMKGSSVWLHWNYYYIGDGKYTGAVVSTHYKEQVIEFKHTSNSRIQVLAKRIGQNGALTLQSPTPAPFNGRVEVISSNSTLVIHRLQYNDSPYQFISRVIVNVDVGGGPNPNIFDMKPTVSITINGMKIRYIL